MNSVKIWKLITESVMQTIPVMLLYVLESKGSSPGRQGFFMAVTADGRMQGSVGGGIMEHKFVELARKSLEMGFNQTEPGNEVRKQYHDKSAAKDQSGMICSGEQTIYLYRVKEQDLPAIHSLVASLEQYQNGTLTLSPGKLSFNTTIPEKDFDFSFQSEQEWIYKEKTGYKNQLFIIGGGHCALALSKLMHTMDFYIRIYDDRKDLKTMIENDAAHEKHWVNDYSDLKEMIHPGLHFYVVVMTFGYRTDDLAIRALQGKKFGYIGLLGSKNKVAKMFEDYQAEGIEEEWLRIIHTPIGIAIKSQTPEEIAVSIAAQIIQVKNEKI